MMKLRIASLAVGGKRLAYFDGEEIDNYFTKTLPSQANYAERLGVDYELTTIRSDSYPSAAWQKLDVIQKAYEDGVDRLLFLDADIIIDEDAPNIFDELPDVTWIKRDALIERTKDMTKYVNWRKSIYGEVPGEAYYNTGVMMLPRKVMGELIEHFEPPYVEGIFEQHYLNRAFELANVKIHNLPSCWNFMIVREMDVMSKQDKHFKHFASERGKKILKKFSLAPAE